MSSWPFFKYFFTYILRAKTRQRLLFIAVIGLFLSAFALMVIQGIMGGLQHGLISRSKNVHGSQLILLSDASTDSIKGIKDYLDAQNLPYYVELEAEVMLKHKNFVAPAKLHGIDLSGNIPHFLRDKDFKGLVLGSDLASKVRAQFLDEMQIIAPGVTDSLMGEIPRFVSDSLTDYLYTEINEVDDFEGFARLELVQNLLRSRTINQIRIYAPVSSEMKKKIETINPELTLRWKSWEDMNAALVWSLNLETKVMLFLFISMSLLVAIAITSGLMIFYSKIRRDLMSFWILGMPQKRLIQLSFKFTLILSGVTCILGGSFGLLILTLLESFGHEIMPDIFIERRLPVQLNFNNISLSLLIPFAISFVFSWFSFLNFRKENQSFVNVVRSLS